jgi:hypothetical protein
MRVHGLGGIVIVIVATASALTGPTQGATRISAFKPLILNGCVQGPEASVDRFRSWDFAHSGDTTSPLARAAGPSHGSRRIKIVGGFWPSTNVAAQAGALDPTQAAMVVSGGIGVRESTPLVEAPVRNARPLLCPQS